MLTDPKSYLNRKIADSIDGTRVQFGPYLGRTWMRLPSSYLNQIRMEYPEDSVEYTKAQKILDKRGYYQLPSHLRVTLHAVDRFTARCNKEYLHWSKKDEGAVACLYRLAGVAYDRMDSVETSYDKETRLRSKRVAYKGMLFVFVEGEDKATLVTVYKNKEENV